MRGFFKSFVSNEYSQLILHFIREISLEHENFRSHKINFSFLKSVFSIKKKKKSEMKLVFDILMFNGTLVIKAAY